MNLSMEMIAIGVAVVAVAALVWYLWRAMRKSTFEEEEMYDGEYDGQEETYDDEVYTPPFADPAAESYADLGDRAAPYEVEEYEDEEPYEGFAVLEAAPYGDGNADFRASA